MEGKLQNAYKASYPPGDAREDWKIFKELANLMKISIGFSTLNQLRENIIKRISLKVKSESLETSNSVFVQEDIVVNNLDYYFTNSIARSSKTMNECRQIKKKLNFIGIEKAS